MPLWLAVLFLCLSVCVTERVHEHGREARIKDHSYQEVDVVPFDEAEDEHRGIPVVEDDVPEWVKLTFADKFIALGETEFLSFSEGDAHDFDQKRPSHHHQDEDGYVYEYVYSDEEEFSDEHEHEHHSQSKPPHEAESEDDFEPMDEQATQEDGMAQLARTVREHRESLSNAAPAHAPAISVPLNNAPTSFLEEQEEVRNGPPSHERGSRRAAQRKGRQNPTPSSFAQEQLRKRADSPIHLASRGPEFALPSRYAAPDHTPSSPIAPHKVRLNPSDPRLKRLGLASDEGSIFLEMGSSSQDLPLDRDSAARAKQHKEWLELHADPANEVKLPKLERHMYSNGMPVEDWEVGYVDNILKQFGYEN